MKKSICLYFQVHQPNRLRLYRFFDIGKDSHYYDDFANRTILRRVAQKCYLPMNALILELIEANKGAFKVAFSISGSVLEQFDRYAPEVIESFRKLAQTGCVEFLSETYYHSLASLASPIEFKNQVLKHRAAIEHYFGVTPKAFRNTELIYSDAIGEMVYDMGFKTMLTEGAKHVLGWKSPNYLYANSINPKLRLLLRNYKLSDAISLNFVNNSLTTESFVEHLNECNEEVVNIFANYETFGEDYDASTGIMDFMKYLPDAILNNSDFEYAKPIEMLDKLQTMSMFDAPIPLSSMGEERDLSLWMGNDLQDDAIQTLYSCASKMKRVKDEDVIRDWNALQDANNFYHLCTKYSGTSPYDYYINFMNILTDFKERING